MLNGIIRFLEFLNTRRLQITSYLGFMLISFCAVAQQTDSIRKTPAQAGVVTEVSGRVVDAVTGKGLAYTGVSFFGSVYSTHADEQGKFILSAPGSFNLVVFSNIDYQKMNIFHLKLHKQLLF